MSARASVERALLVRGRPTASRLAACLLVLAALVPSAARATPPLEWSLSGGRDTGYRASDDLNRSVVIAPRVGRDYVFSTNYNYFFELRQIAAFLQRWQVADPASPDFGGMIEAEAGSLADVIETDNTLEAIVVWSRFAVVFGDTATYGENVRRAWEYCWRYPAWREEGSAGEDYYRNHNCAWGLFAVLAFEEAYGDSGHGAYADTCAAYMVDHPMSFSASGAYRWINPFVTGWMAGNLYLFAEAREDAALADTAVGMGSRVKAWIEADPATRLAEERWAMSSGTSVWGVCNSVFRADPAQGAAWVATYGPLVDTFQPWRNAPDDGYDWDNAWNVAYANAHYAMYCLSGDGQYAANFHALTDTLLSYDTDDDGGIPATTVDPPSEDMTWISSYLWLMGVYNLTTHLPVTDAGVLRLRAEAVRPPFHVGDSLVATCTFANFGAGTLGNVALTLQLVDPTGAAVSVAESAEWSAGENTTISVTWPLAEAGGHELRARAICEGDENPANDTTSVSVEVFPVVQVTGTLQSSISGGPIGGRVVASYLAGQSGPAPYDTCWAGEDDGRWQAELPSGSYRITVDPRLPYPTHVETLAVGDAPLEKTITFDHVAAVVLVDDDDGDGVEGYVQASCDSLGLEARRWDRGENPIPSAAHLVEFPDVGVVWLTGEATDQALQPEEQDTLTALLQGGGVLLLTGQNIVEYCGEGVLFAQAFPVSFDGNTFDHILDLDPEDPFNAGYQHIGTAGFGSANNQRAQDALIVHDTPGVVSFPFVSYSPGKVAGVRCEGGGARRILLGFGIEGVGLPTQPQGYMPRHVLLGRCLAWLRGIAGSPDERARPQQPVLAVGPNPCHGIIRIRYRDPWAAKTMHAGIYDAAGRLVARAAIAGQGGCLEGTFDASHLPSGFYLCRTGDAAPKDFVILK